MTLTYSKILLGFPAWVAAHEMEIAEQFAILNCDEFAEFAVDSLAETFENYAVSLYAHAHGMDLDVLPQDLAPEIVTPSIDELIERLGHTVSPEPLVCFA